VFKTLSAALIFILLASAPVAAGNAFDFKRDTFAFSNDTVLRYGLDEGGRLHMSRRDKPVEFGHRCFVLARGALQFHQFVRFDPSRPKLSRAEYRRLVKKIFRIPVWFPAPREKLVIPGYPDLRAFSIAYEGLLKEALGNWIPSYIRVGNWRMAWPFPRCGHARAARWLARSIEAGRPRAVYLARFPHMNHVVVVYDMERRANGDLRFIVYDPNYPGAPTTLDYQAAARSFDFPKRWYFPGGRVNLFRVFISPFH
jgi:hypothetical protein